VLKNQEVTGKEVTVDHFFQVEIRIGRISKVEDFPKARKPAYKLWIDFGPLGTKQSSAQLTKRYSKDDLVDRLVVAVTNFPPRQIADFISEVLVLGVDVGDGEIVLLRPDFDAPLGALIS
jgi:tRNA-binding protein